MLRTVANLFNNNSFTYFCHVVVDVLIISISSLSELDLSRENSESAFAVQLAGERCGQTLRRLNLSWCPKLPRSVFLQTFPAFRNLRSLSLSHVDAVGDEYLAVVGVYAEKLEELDVSFTGASDAGVLCLFSPQDEMGNDNDRFGKCLLLRSLNLEHTHVSEAAVSAALLSLEKLSHLVHPDSVCAVHSALFENPERRFALTSLSSAGAAVEDFVLHSAIRACDRATRISINTYELMGPASLLPLTEAAASDLTHLEVTNLAGTYNKPSMQMCLGPVLTRHGQTLLSLSLVEVADVNLARTLTSCPNLRTLHLGYNVSYASSSSSSSSATRGKSQNRYPTNCLRVLEVLAFKDDEDGSALCPSKQDFLRLLAAPRLEKLLLTSCPNLCDEVVEETLRAHTFPRIASLEIHGCNNVSLDSLAPVLLGDNPLSDVKLMDCKEIHRKDIDSYRKRLKKARLDKAVAVEWA